ncbi:hypothetical protein NRA33_15615 [Acinetobacter baumannii]|nr:hypothetical protein [Acinetobacter baumannii]
MEILSPINCSEIPDDLNELRDLFEYGWVNGDTDYSWFWQWHSSFDEKFELYEIKTGSFGDGYIILIKAILSAKYGKPIGYKFSKLLQVAHVLLEHHPEFWKHFLLVVKHYGHMDLLKSQDIKGKLFSKTKKISTQDFKPDHSYNSLIEFLCPIFQGKLFLWEYEQTSIEEKTIELPIVTLQYLFEKPCTFEELGFSKTQAESCLKRYLLKCFDSDQESNVVKNEYVIKAINIAKMSSKDRSHHSVFSRRNVDWQNTEIKLFLSLVFFLGLEEFIEEGFYCSNSDCFFLKLKWEQLKITKEENYLIEKRFSRILELTIGQYEWNDMIGHGSPSIFLDDPISSLQPPLNNNSLII